jgi:hypothetical protein
MIITVGNIIGGYQIAGDGGEVTPYTGLVVGNTTETLDQTEYNFQDRVPNGPNEQAMLVDGDRVYLAAARPFGNQYHSFGSLHYFDVNNGLYPAIIDTTEYQDGIDNHLTTSIYFDDDYVYIFQENDHKQEMEVWRGPKDFSKFELWDSFASFARCKTFRKDANNFFVLAQENGAQAVPPFDGQDPLAIIPINKTTGVGTPVRIAYPDQAGRRMYGRKPLGPEVDSNGYHHVLFVSSTSQGTEEMFDCLTTDFNTYRNLAGTDSFDVAVDGPPTSGYLRTNGYRVLGEQGGPNAADFLSCLDPDGTLYSLFYEFVSGEFRYIVSNASGSTETVITTFPHTILGIGYASDSRSIDWFAKIDGAFYASIAIQSGSYRKFHLYKTEDFVTWTDLGDLTPGVNQNIHRCSSVENYVDLDQSKNFVFYSCQYFYDGDPEHVGQVYVTRVAFDSIKTEVPVPYTTALTSITDLTWKVAYESDDVAQTSNIITQLNDKSGNGRHATAVGEPVLQNGSIVNYGSSYFNLASVANFATDTVFTWAGVVKKVGDGYLMCMADNADANKAVYLKVYSGGSVGVERVLTAGSTDVIKSYTNVLGDEYFIAVVVGDGKHIRIFINGEESNKIFANQSSVISSGLWFNSQPNDTLTIGARVSTTTSNTPINFKAWAYTDTILTTAQRKQLENFLADKYDITLGQFGSAPTYEPEAEVTFARMSTPPTTGQMDDLNDLVVAIKNSQSLQLGEHSMGNLFDALWIRATYASQSALLNTARPAFDSTISGSPTFTTDRGFKSAASGYLNRNFNTSKHSRFASNSCAHFGYVIEDVTRGNKTIGGSSVGTNVSERIFPRNASDLSSVVTTATTALTQASTSMIGFHVGYRDGTIRYNLREGVSTSSITAASSFNNANTYELAENDDGTATFFLDATVAVTGWGSKNINFTALRTAIRDWLIAKGVTGL